MTEQPEALRLADALDTGCPTEGESLQAAAKLRRLHQSEREGWRYADELEQERKRLHSVNAQLLEALEQVAAAECEACAKVCDEEAAGYQQMMAGCSDARYDWKVDGCMDCAAAIRARGN